jgi:cytochrome c oxidase cbb3-type subunit I
MNAPVNTSRTDWSMGPPLDPVLAVSCRTPLLLLLVCGVGWLVASSLFGLVASLKFHAPGLLAGSAWLTYGRVQPAHLNLFLYGFALPCAWALALWMLVRLGRTALRLPVLVITGTVLWNVGVAIGGVGILAGHRVGFDGFDLPRYALILLFGGYLLMGVPALLTFRARVIGELFVSQWFLLAALFWFPWIFSTALVLLVFEPVRGVMQAVVHWWYMANLSWIALGFLGLGMLFYAIPRLSGRALHSQYQALAAFWMLALFATWTGVPDTAPLPAWIPAMSIVFSVLTLVPLLALAQNWHQTMVGSYREIRTRWPLPLAMFSGVAFLLAGFLLVISALPAVSQVLHFSFFTPARQWLFLYGFVAMAIFTGLYMSLPDLLEGGLPYRSLVRVHVWCAALGISLYVLPLLLGGIAQGRAMQDPAIAFTDALRPGLMALRIATLGDVLLLCGHVALLSNVLLAFIILGRRYWMPILAEAGRTQPAEATQ